MYVYFASRISLRGKLKSGSEMSFWPHIVTNLNLFHRNTGLKWSNRDLEKDYFLTPTISFKKNRIPRGIPHLYRGIACEKELIYDEKFPYLFKNKYPIHLKKLTVEERNMIINLSASLYQNFCLVGPCVKN